MVPKNLNFYLSHSFGNGVAGEWATNKRSQHLIKYIPTLFLENREWHQVNSNPCDAAANYSKGLLLCKIVVFNLLSNAPFHMHPAPCNYFCKLDMYTILYLYFLWGAVPVLYVWDDNNSIDLLSYRPTVQEDGGDIIFKVCTMQHCMYRYTPKSME